jgi:teichuronic acid exporter
LENKDLEFYKSRTKYSVKWNAILSISGTMVSFVVGIVLARLLEPSDYGLVALVSTFIALVSIFINAGTGSALIQKKEVSQLDLSTVFFYNLTIGIFAFFILFLFAPSIALYFAEPRLQNIIRILAVGPLISSLSIVQESMMQRHVALKERTMAQLTGQLIAGAIGIGMAFSGMGVWALVASGLLSQGISTLLYWIQGRWTPSLIFSNASFKEIWEYSSKVLFGNVLGSVLQKIDIIIISKFVSPATIGFFHKGKTLGMLPALQLGNIVTKSYFPILSRLRADKNEFLFYFSQNFRKIFQFSISVFSFLFINASFIFQLLYGLKWLGACGYFRLACIIGMLYTISAYLVYCLNALGRPDLNLKISYLLSPTRFILIIAVIYFKPMEIGVGILLVTILIMILEQLWLVYQLSSMLEVMIRVILKPLVMPAIFSAISLILVYTICKIVSVPQVGVLLISFILFLPLLIQYYKTRIFYMLR